MAWRHEPSPLTGSPGAIARAIVVILAWLLPACAPFPQARPSSTIVPRGRVVIPMDMHGLPYVQTRVADGGEPQLLMIDTGYWCLGLSPECAALLKARQRPVFPWFFMDVTGTVGIQWTYHRVAEMRIGDMRVQDLDADVRPIRMYVNDPGFAGGILGLNVFRDCLLTLDFPNGDLIVETGELPPPDGKTILPLRRNVESLQVQVMLAGRPIWAKIDSGAYSYLLISDDIARNLPFKQPLKPGDDISGALDKKVPSRVGTLNGPFILGKHTLSDLDVEVGGRSNRVLLGVRLLEQYRVTIDQKNARVRFERP